MSSDFASQFNKDKEEAQKARGEWFDFPKGTTKVRILVEPIKMFQKYDKMIKKFITCWHDCGFTGSMRYLTRMWVYETDKDGNDKNRLVITKLPYSIMEQVVKYMVDEDYSFSSFPMPYDIKIEKNGEGLDTEYHVIPSPKQTEVPAEAIQSLEGQKPLHEILQAMQEKSRKEFGPKVANNDEGLDTIEYPTDDLNPNDIPF